MTGSPLFGSGLEGRRERRNFEAPLAFRSTLVVLVGGVLLGVGVVEGLLRSVAEEARRWEFGVVKERLESRPDGVEFAPGSGGVVGVELEESAEPSPLKF